MPVSLAPMIWVRTHKNSIFFDKSNIFINVGKRIIGFEIAPIGIRGA